MTHLGLNLSSDPAGGGAHQHSMSVMRATSPLADRGWLLTAFVSNAAWDNLIPDSFNVVRCSVSPWQRAAASGYRRIHRSPAGLRKAGRFLPETQAMNASGCDLIVFAGQGAGACQLRVPTLATVHDLMHRYEPHFGEYQEGEFQRRERHYKCISKNATAILVDSELGKRQLLESYGGRPDRIFVLPLIPPPYLATSHRINVADKYSLFDQYLFYPAQFWEHKNHVRLVEAVALVKARGLPVRLVLVGAPKNNYQRTIARIAALGLEDDVRILGYVPNEEMYSLYESALATVFVSLIGPTNIPPLEALSVGSPLVVSNRYAMPEQVGEAALLVDPTDVEDIAEKITLIWTDEELRKRLVERGRAQSTLWTESRFEARLQEIITQLINSRRHQQQRET